MKLLDQVRHCLRVRRYAYRTEQCYVRWVEQYVRFHKGPDGFRHPATLGAAEVEAFLTHLAVERHVSASTQNQALGALLFLYRAVLRLDLPGRGAGSVSPPEGGKSPWRLLKSLRSKGLKRLATFQPTVESRPREPSRGRAGEGQAVSPPPCGSKAGVRYCQGSFPAPPSHDGMLPCDS